MTFATGSDLGQAPTERASTADNPPGATRDPAGATADPAGATADPARATIDPMGAFPPSAPAGELLARAHGAIAELTKIRDSAR